MLTRYRIVHFVPDPFTGARIPIAAVVAYAGTVALALATRLPSADCLGRVSLLATMHMVLHALAAVESLDVLPIAVGPHAVLGDARYVPEGVANPVAWVTEHVLPSDAEESR